MIIIIGFILLILFAGLGFAAKILWFGLILGLVFVVAGFVSGRSNRL